MFQSEKTFNYVKGNVNKIKAHVYDTRKPEKVESILLLILFQLFQWKTFKLNGAYNLC